LLFGGSFDPFHNGHIHMLKTVLDSLKINTVIVMPNFMSPHKQTLLFSAEKRLDMIHKVIKEDLKNHYKQVTFQCSNFEIKQKEVCYTIDTVVALKKENPEHHIFLLVGSDNFFSFHKWKDYKKIVDLVSLCVVKRSLEPSSSYQQYLKEYMPQLSKQPLFIFGKKPIYISSTAIRKKMSQKLSLKHLVPRCILNDTNPIKQNKKITIIGVTGKVGVGKTFLVDKLALDNKLYDVIDLDKVGHYVLTKASVIHSLTKAFGNKILDKNNKIDRKKLGEIVFSNKDDLITLNQVSHPLIKTHVEKRIKTSQKSSVLIVGSLIEDIGLSKNCHYIIAILANHSRRTSLLGRKKKIELYQKSDTYYKAMATHNITNTFSKDMVEKFSILVQNLISKPKEL